MSAPPEDERGGEDGEERPEADAETGAGALRALLEDWRSPAPPGAEDELLAEMWWLPRR